jgi:hypothetical protein
VNPGLHFSTDGAYFCSSYRLAGLPFLQWAVISMIPSSTVQPWPLFLLYVLDQGIWVESADKENRITLELGIWCGVEAKWELDTMWSFCFFFHILCNHVTLIFCFYRVDFCLLIISGRTMVRRKAAQNNVGRTGKAVPKRHHVCVWNHVFLWFNIVVVQGKCSRCMRYMVGQWIFLMHLLSMLY